MAGIRGTPRGDRGTEQDEIHGDRRAGVAKPGLRAHATTTFDAGIPHAALAWRTVSEDIGSAQ